MMLLFVIRIKHSHTFLFFLNIQLFIVTAIIDITKVLIKLNMNEIIIIINSSSLIFL